MSNIKKDMPLLARHEGVWDGWYRYYDAEGNKQDEHKSRLICRFPEGEKYPYHQTNLYAWADGKQEMRDFPAVVRDDRIWFDDNPLIEGWAAEVPLDTFNRTLMLNWTRKGEEGVYLYELINLSDCNRYRCRTWHWIKDGILQQRTCMSEERIDTDWSKYGMDSFPEF